MPKKYLFAYICQWCGKRAFFTDIKPESGSLIQPIDFWKPDGTQPRYGDLIVCPLCKKELPTLYVENIVDSLRISL